MRLLSAVFLGLAIAGCATATEPAGHLAFTRDVDNAGRAPLVALPGTIEYRSSFYLPCVPYGATAELAGAGAQVIEIHVVGRMGSGCFAATGSTNYLTQVTGLPSATYTLRVIHSWPDTGRAADTVVTTTVVVP